MTDICGVLNWNRDLSIVCNHNWSRNYVERDGKTVTVKRHCLKCPVVYETTYTNCVIKGERYIPVTTGTDN